MPLFSSKRQRHLTRFGLSLQWRHNDHNDVSNHQPRGRLLNRLFRRRSKKTSKLRVTGLYAGNSPGPVNAPHKGPVTQKMIPFDDVIMMSSKSIFNRGSKITNFVPDISGVWHNQMTITTIKSWSIYFIMHSGGWGCEVSCGGHHRLRGKTTTGSALNGVVFDIAQILAYLEHNMSRSQLYLAFGHFGWLLSFFRSITFWWANG